MGLGTNHSTVTTANNFIGEQWSDEVIAAYKQKLVLGNLVTKINFKGKKGDTLNIPVPARGDASAKAASTAVTLIADTAGVVQVVINKHFEYSKLYEDIAEMQALASMRKFYTNDGGYALAKKVDQDLHLLGAGFNGGSISGATNLYEAGGVIGGDGSTAFSGSANTNTGNGTALTDAGIRRVIQGLEDADVDSADLSFVIPPVEARVLRGIARFTEQAFVGSGDAIKTGRLGNLYGVEVFTSTNCPWVHVNSVTGTQSVTFSSTAPTGTAFADAFGLTVNWTASTPTDTKYRACLMLHKDAMCHAEQMGIRTQAQYKQEYLGTLVTSDTVYGVKELRDTFARAVIVPA
jgi:hypothetical protein